jgi:hypothetical protein
LLVDGREFARRGATGAPRRFEATATGGYAVIDGGTKYRGLGLVSAERHLLVDFDQAGGAALVSTWDRLRGARPHTYTWQLNAGGVLDGDGFELTSGRDDGRATFVVRARTGATLRAVVLSPADAEIDARDGLVQVRTRATDADLWIAMALDREGTARITASGGGLDAVAAIGPARLRLDAGAGRLALERAPSISGTN